MNKTEAVQAESVCAEKKTKKKLTPAPGFSTEEFARHRKMTESYVSHNGYCKKALQRYTDNLNESGKSHLAKYLAHRKAVIDAFELISGLPDENALEDAVHNIIMPVRSASNDIQAHNLWLIDERLTYHKYLASAKSFKTVTDIDSDERPDFLVFNNPAVCVDNKEKTSKAVIVEFKHLMLDGDKDNEDPVAQVTDYLLKLRKRDQIKDESGREIHLDKRVPVCCYVICDLTSSVREILDIRNYKPLPDNEGYIFYNDNLNAVIEVLSFYKLINDARERNKILFRKM